MALTISLKVNGQTSSVTIGDIETPLLWVLRDRLGLTAAKYGCGVEICGACSVLIDGQKEKSCNIKASEVQGRDIWTLEGLIQKADADYTATEAAWIANQVPQCGYCQPGMVMGVVAARKAGHHGSEILPEVPHICVCGTYARVKKAVSGL